MAKCILQLVHCAPTLPLDMYVSLYVEQEHRSLDSRKASARGQRSMDEWAGVEKLPSKP